MHHGNTADTGGRWLLHLQLTGLICSQRFTVWRAASTCFHLTDGPASSPRARSAAGPGPGPPRGAPWTAAGRVASSRQPEAHVRTVAQSVHCIHLSAT